MTTFAHFAPKLFNTPVAIHPGHSDLCIAALGDYFAGAKTGGLGALAGLAASDRDVERPRPYEFVDGVAIIALRGTLVQRIGSLWWISSYLGVTGYDFVRMCFLDALADPVVEAIVFDVDSPGGDVAGCFDLVDTIYAARGRKPIWAILGENAYSAAYAIASAADPGRLCVPRTGGTGSVGIIYMHCSFEHALDKAGVEVTLVTKGDLKAERSDMKALTPGALKRLKAEVEVTGDLFDATVARNRGLKNSDVFDTQAGCFMGGKGVEVGFADKVMAPDQAFRAVLKALG
jgi:ClpP class serine protease